MSDRGSGSAEALPRLSVFISYRRDDTAGFAGRLYEDLAEHFGAESVFMDVDTLDPGQDFVETIDEAIGRCTVLLALIGSNWSKAVDASGARRIENDLDYVRLELASALRSGKRVIPVLLQGASMPKAADLPEDLRPLARRHGMDVSHSRWRADVAQLIEVLERVQRQTVVPVAEVPVGAVTAVLPENPGAGVSPTLVDVPAGELSLASSIQPSSDGRGDRGRRRRLALAGVAAVFVSAIGGGAILAWTGVIRIGDGGTGDVAAATATPRVAVSEPTNAPTVAPATSPASLDPSQSPSPSATVPPSPSPSAAATPRPATPSPPPTRAPVRAAQDDDGPVGGLVTIRAPGGSTSLTTTRKVTVLITRRPSDASAVTRMIVGTSPKRPSGNGVAIGSSMSVTLAGSKAGTKRAYVWFRDAHGNWSPTPATDVIAFDNPPTARNSSYDLTGNASWCTGVRFTIVGDEATDVDGNGTLRLTRVWAGTTNYVHKATYVDFGTHTVPAVKVYTFSYEVTDHKGVRATGRISYAIGPC